MKVLLHLICFLFSIQLGIAQVNHFAKSQKAQTVKKEWSYENPKEDHESFKLFALKNAYFKWGYNRSFYAKADALFHHHADQYDFRLYGVEASDRPDPFNFALYFNPVTLTIPQYNWEIGLELKHLPISFALGHDHMKYVANMDQSYKIDGFYRNQRFDGTEEPIDWLKFEHTNGFNLLFFNIGFMQHVFKIQHSQKDKNICQLQFYYNLGPALFIPKTRTSLYNPYTAEYEVADTPFRVAGLAFRTGIGTKLSFFDQFFISMDAQYSATGVYHAAVDFEGSRLIQTPIHALELIGMAGFQYNF